MCPQQDYFTPAVIKNQLEGVIKMKKELKKAQKEYMVAKAAHEAALAIEEEAKTNVLRDNVFHNEETGERITSTTADFLMSDSEFFQYCELVHAEMLRMGLDIPAENTADYKTRPALMAAENKLIDISIAISPVKIRQGLETARNNLKYRQEMIDLTLRLAL